jgi:hypothetical protein
VNTEIKIFKSGNGWSFEIILSKDDSQARLFRTRYALLFEDAADAGRAACALLTPLAGRATLYILPDANGWTWELWQPADTDKPDFIIEPVGLDPATSFGAAQGDGILWAERLGLEVV